MQNQIKIIMKKLKKTFFGLFTLIGIFCVVTAYNSINEQPSGRKMEKRKNLKNLVLRLEQKLLRKQNSLTFITLQELGLIT